VRNLFNLRFGRAEFVNDDIYVGEFKDGRISGHGVMTYSKLSEKDDNNNGIPDSATYKGEWKRGQRNGKGE
jgi:hypothetical protein